MGYLDYKHLADPDCKICRGDGRYRDYSEDEWGMVLEIRCDCTKQERTEPADTPDDLKLCRFCERSTRMEDKICGVCWVHGRR